MQPGRTPWGQAGPSPSGWSTVIDADPDLQAGEKGWAKAGLWSEALEAALNLSLGWAIEHLPDLWKERKW